MRSERIRRGRILHPNESSPLYGDLYGLLLKGLEPVAVLGPALGRVEGIERAFVFGSWAARYGGEPGFDPADIDVIAVGVPSQLAVARAERELSGRLGRKVSVTVVSPADWEAADSGFLREVRERPLVALDLTGPEA